MNSVLLNSEDIKVEIQEMVKNLENIKAGIDMFGEMVKKHIANQNI